MQSNDNKLSWFILSVVTFIVTLEVGIIKGFSILLPALKEQLGSQTWIIGSCISIIYGWGYLIGLSGSSVVSAVGVRLSLMFTGLLSCVGLIVCTFASNEIALLFGNLLVGFLLVQENIAIGLIPEYFEKYYHIAVNVHAFGCAIAIIISPLLTQFLLDLYGWRGTLLLLSGLNLQSVVFGALIKPRSALLQKQLDDLPPQKLTLVSTDEDVSNGPVSFRTLRKIGKIFDIKLLLRLPFTARVFLPGMFSGYVFTSWLIYMVSFALSNGASMKESSFVATWGGVGVAVIRIALPILNTYFTYRVLMYTGSILMAASLAASTHFTSVIGMSSSSVVFCMAFGMTATEIYVALKDVVDEKQYTNAVSWFHLAFGFGTIAGGIITDLFFDMTGSFIISFWLLLAVSLLIAITLGLENIWMWRTNDNRVPLPQPV